MNLFSLFDCWKPQLRLNTDIFPVYNMKNAEKVSLLSSFSPGNIKIGDHIKTGQQISEDCISPYTGTVENIGHIKGLDLKNLFLITVAVHSKEECIHESNKISNIREASADTLLSALKKAGYESLSYDSIDTVIINVLDKDPICTVNHQLFRENSQLLSACLDLIKKISGCKRIIFAITKQLYNSAKKSIGDEAEIAIIDPLYPNGISEILISAICPDEEDKSKTGIIDLERLFSMLHTLRNGKPYQYKLITLYVPHQSIEKNIQVNIGTPLSEILQQFDIALEDEGKVIINGTMSGVAWYNFNYPVTNSIHSIIVQNKSNVYTTENNPCINCGKCVAVCPINLQVNLITRYSEFRLFEDCQRLDVEHCIECGLCAYSCTSRRPLVHYIRHAKTTLVHKEEEIVS